MKGGAALAHWMGVMTLGLGCAEGTDDESTSERTDYCVAVCASLDRCGYTLGSDCVANCVHYAWNWFDRINPGAVVAAAPCLRTRPCSEVPDTYENACFDLVVPTLEPTAAAVHYCETLSPVWFDCGYHADTRACVESVGVWADSVLDRAAQCAGGTCEEVDQCVTSSFGG